MKVVTVTCILVLLIIIAGSSNAINSNPVGGITLIKTDTTPAPAGKKADKKADKIVKLDKAAVAAGLELVNGSDCTVCHKVAEKSIGPGYKEVAAKYKPTQANIDLLVKKITEGGTGVWGEVPMTPHPGLPAPDAQKMVQYILSLK